MRSSGLNIQRWEVMLFLMSRVDHNEMIKLRHREALAWGHFSKAIRVPADCQIWDHRATCPSLRKAVPTALSATVAYFFFPQISFSLVRGLLSWGEEHSSQKNTYCSGLQWTPVVLDSGEASEFLTSECLTSEFLPLCASTKSWVSRFTFYFLPVYSVAGVMDLPAGSGIPHEKAFLGPSVTTLSDCLVQMHISGERKKEHSYSDWALTWMSGEKQRKETCLPVPAPLLLR